MNYPIGEGLTETATSHDPNAVVARPIGQVGQCPTWHFHKMIFLQPFYRLKTFTELSLLAYIQF